MKPILFNTEMVRAILDGRKTVTRRVVKAKIEYGLPCGWDCNRERIRFECGYGTGKPHYNRYFTPPYLPDDVLYVRETWRPHAAWSGSYSGCEIEYKAGGENLIINGPAIAVPETVTPWRPSIQMPREAARIFLRVTDVRVERLNDIDEAGAIAEGLYEGYRYHGEGSCALSARQAFSWLWQFITLDAPAWQSWALNPWVFVIKFERCEKPKEAINGSV